MRRSFRTRRERAGQPRANESMKSIQAIAVVVWRDLRRPEYWIMNFGVAVLAAVAIALLPSLFNVGRNGNNGSSLDFRLSAGTQWRGISFRDALSDRVV